MSARCSGVYDRGHRAVRMCRVKRSAVGEREAGTGPGSLDERAAAGERDISRLPVLAAEADVGGDDVAGRHLFQELAIRADHRDAARDQGRDADIAACLDREAVEALIAG